ncbi:MAG TPA: DUF58 domain-containing protein [Kineosporiaceae bacterium]
MALTARAALAVLAGAVPVMLRPGWAAVLGWAGLVVLAVVVDLMLAGSPRALRLEREVPASVRLGEPADAALTVTNSGRRPVRGVLRDAWQPAAGAQQPRHQLNVPAGERRRLVTRLLPTRRGDRQADRVTVRSVGPLGLAARQRSLPLPGRIRVLPPFSSRRHLPSKLARLREIDGRTALRIRGQGTEFDSLRDYVDGDDVRSIDWRATARRQQVVVRTWRPERDRRVLLVLDTSRTAAARVADAPRLDAAMDAALLLAALATRAGDRVDLLAVDRRVRARVEGVTGSRLLPALVEALAPLDADLVEADWGAVVTAVRQRLAHRALVVLLTPLESAALEEGLLPVLPRLTARHQVLVASVSDPAVTAMARGRHDAYAVYGAAAAERARLDRSALTAEVARLGVEVVDADPADLPPRLADRYLALKAAGRL